VKTEFKNTLKLILNILFFNLKTNHFRIFYNYYYNCLKLVPIYLFLLAGFGCGGSGGSGSPNGNSVALSHSSVLLNPDTPIVNVTATFKGAGLVVGTLPGQAVPPWLSVALISQTTSSANVAIGEKASPGPGRFTCTLRFITGNADASGQAYKDLPIEFDVPIPVSRTTAQMQGSSGSSLTAFHAIDIYPDGHPWTAVPSAPWIHVSISQGTDHDTLVVGGDASALAVGEHDGSLAITDSTTGLVNTVKVHAAVEARELVIRRLGIALTSIEQYQVLTATLPIADNAGGITPWSAQADQTWLQLDHTAGMAGDSLTITADPAGLSDGLHYSTITLSPTDGSTGGTKFVRVGIYVDHSSSVVKDINIPVNGLGYPYDAATDPVRPFAYWVTGDGQLSVYNIYTGTCVQQLVKAGAKFSAAAVTQDGKTLWLADGTGQALIPIDLSTMTFGAPLNGVRVAPAGNLFRMSAGRIGGRDVLVTSDAQIIDLSTEAILADASPGQETFQYAALSHDGRTWAVKDGGNGNHDITIWRVYSALGHITVTMEPHKPLNEVGDHANLGFDANDTQLISCVPNPSGRGPTSIRAYPFAVLERGAFLNLPPYSQIP